MAGQVAGQLKEEKPIKEILEDIYNGYLNVKNSL